jgi:Protein kinase domain
VANRNVMERATAAPAATAPAATELVLGRYRPLRPLGSGSSGSVWLARDERSGLDVALKIVSREGRAGDRAEREAGAARRLRHPSCQRIYDHAVDGRHVYIAYEYVAGATLREVTRAGRLTDGESIEAAAQVLEGLAHAHARGIVHRDVKPANVLLADGPEISVRLLDFGLARYAQADTLTAVGDVPGTLAYISPERLHGDAATPASDVWSVGVMLWEALAARHPFWAPSLVATSRRIQEGAPSLASVRPDLPRPLVTAVNRALDLDATRRPTAAQLAKRLRALRAERPRPAPRPTPPRDAKPKLPARMVPVVLAGVFSGWCAAALPFYPSGWPVALALVAAVLTFASARGGLALALTIPILPLGNISLGLALLYGLVAAAWFVLHLRDPRAGFAFSMGPLLAPLGALGLLPLLLQPVRRGWRRALHAGTGVVVVAIVAGIAHDPLPFGAGRFASLRIDEERSPLRVASVLRHALLAHPAVALEALVLAAAAAALPFARRFGLWGLAGYGAATIAAGVLVAPHADPIPTVLSAWLTCIGLALWETRRSWLPRARPLFAGVSSN